MQSGRESPHKTLPKDPGWRAVKPQMVFLTAIPLADQPASRVDLPKACEKNSPIDRNTLHLNSDQPSKRQQIKPLTNGPRIALERATDFGTSTR
jgi:hypothetical protein